VHERAILDLASRIKITKAAGQGRQDATASVTIKLNDGRELSRRVASFKGTPQRPLDQGELKEKFMLLTRHLEPRKMEATFARLQHLESEQTLDWLGV
jgi:2-methylcitrate dehydratase PrpD